MRLLVIEDDATLRESLSRKLEESGFATVALALSEFRKGWGSLTCLSILF